MPCSFCVKSQQGWSRNFYKKCFLSPFPWPPGSAIIPTNHPAGLCHSQAYDKGGFYGSSLYYRYRGRYCFLTIHLIRDYGNENKKPFCLHADSPRGKAKIFSAGRIFLFLGFSIITAFILLPDVLYYHRITASVCCHFHTLRLTRTHAFRQRKSALTASSRRRGLRFNVRALFRNRHPSTLHRSAFPPRSYDLAGDHNNIRQYAGVSSPCHHPVFPRRKVLRSFAREKWRQRKRGR